LHGSISGYDDDDRFRPAVFNAAESVEPARSRQAQIEQHGIERLRVQSSVSLLGRIGDKRGKSQRLGDFAAGFAD